MEAFSFKGFGDEPPDIRGVINDEDFFHFEFTAARGHPYRRRTAMKCGRRRRSLEEIKFESGVKGNSYLTDETFAAIWD